MVRYAFDLYPRTDPVNGAVIRRLQHLQKASYLDEENGTGSGLFVINGDSEDAADIDPLGLQYVRVIEIDDSDVETVRGGFWIEQGKFQALNRKETKKLELKGAGTLAYLQRAVMAPHTYLDIAIGQDPIGGTWMLSAQGPIAGGNFLGSMLWRVIYEAQHFRTAAYTHRHYDGELYTDTHDNDRLESAIPDLVLTFDQDEDSDGNPWTKKAGDFRAQVNEDVLSVTRRLMQAGLVVRLDPDTFELSAWEAPHRTDRTSATWASGKVLLTGPTTEDIDTANILGDAVRDIRPYIQRSVLWAGSGNVWGKAVNASADVPWEGGYEFDIGEEDSDDEDAAEAVAAKHIADRSDASDSLDVPFKLGNLPLEGRYRPWVHISPGDLVSVDTGADAWDYDAATFPVAGILIELRDADWRARAKLGSTFSSVLEPAFHVSGAPSHSHGPNPPLCTAEVTIDETVTSYEFWHWDSGNQLDPAHSGTAGGSGSSVWGEGPSAGGAEGTTHGSNFNHDTGSRRVDGIVAGTTYRISGYYKRYNKDVRFTVMWLDGSGTGVGSELLVHNSNWPTTYTFWSKDVVAPSGAEQLYLLSKTGASGGVGTTGWVDQIRIDVITEGVTVGGTTNEYTGTSSSAARCDHNHDHNDLLNRNEADAHPASAISYDGTETGSSAETVQDRLDEVAANAGPTIDSPRWLLVTHNDGSGPDLVWEGDELVEEWSELV